MLNNSDELIDFIRGRKPVLLRYIPWILLVLMIVLFSLRKISDADTGFHLRGGEWIIQNGAFPDQDTYTYTVSQNDYIDLHWFFQVILYGVFRIAGYGGLSIYTVVLTILLFYLLWLRMRLLGVHSPLIFILLFTAVICMQSRIILRPELFSYIYLTLLLIILDLYYSGQRKLLLWIPVLMLFWVNSQGIFILGWIVIGAYLISIYYRQERPDRDLLYTGLAAVAVTFINPWFIRGVTFPFYLFTRFGRDSVFSNIVEFQPVLAAGGNTSIDFILFYLIGLAWIAGALMSFRKRSLHELIIALAFFYLAMTAIRNIPLFVIAVVPVVGMSFSQAALRLGWPSRFGIYMKMISWAVALFCIFSVFTSMRLLTNAYYTDKRLAFTTGMGLDSLKLPVGATNYLVQRDLEGKLLNDLNTGGWLVWAQSNPVYIDGRLEVMKEELYAEFHASQQEGGLKRLIAKYRPSIVFFNYAANINWIMDIMKISGWKRAHVDEVAAVYLKKHLPGTEEFDLKTLLERRGLQPIRDEQKVWSILKTEKESRITHWLKGLYRKSEYLNPLYLQPATYCDLSGEYEVAERLYLEFLLKDRLRYHAIFNHLGLLYLKDRQFRKAAWCWSRVLEEDPGNPVARNNYQYARSKMKKEK